MLVLNYVAWPFMISNTYDVSFNKIWNSFIPRSNSLLNWKSPMTYIFTTKIVLSQSVIKELNWYQSLLTEHFFFDISYRILIICNLINYVEFLCWLCIWIVILYCICMCTTMEFLFIKIIKWSVSVSVWPLCLCVQIWFYH